MKDFVEIFTMVVSNRFLIFMIMQIKKRNEKLNKLIFNFSLQTS